MCIRPICIHIDHLEVFSRDRTGIVNVPEGFLCNFNEGPSPAMYGHILDRTGIVNAPEGFLCNFNEGPSPAMYGNILYSH